MKKQSKNLNRLFLTYNFIFIIMLNLQLHFLHSTILFHIILFNYLLFLPLLKVYPLYCHFITLNYISFDLKWFLFVLIYQSYLNLFHLSNLIIRIFNLNFYIFNSLKRSYFTSSKFISKSATSKRKILGCNQICVYK
jgi:hypothetical protein